MPEAEKVLVLVRFKHNASRPQTAALVVKMAVIAVEGKFGFFFKDFAVAVKKGEFAVGFQFYGQRATGQGGMVLVFFNLCICFLRHKGVVFVNHPAIGEGLKTDCIFAAGCDADEFGVTHKQQFIFADGQIVHNISLS